MRKDRDFRYPTYPMPYMGINGIPNNIGPNYMGAIPVMPNNDINNLTNQISALEKRISNLESIVGSNNNYNNSTYQMM